MSFQYKRRLEKAIPALEEALEYMRNHNGDLPFDIDLKLRTAFGDAKPGGILDKVMLKDAVLKLLTHPRYRLVAVRYMENPDGGHGISPCIPEDFKPDLERLYGINLFSYTTAMEDRKRFWGSYTWANTDPDDK